MKKNQNDLKNKINMFFEENAILSKINGFPAFRFALNRKHFNTPSKRHQKNRPTKSHKRRYDL